MSVTVVTLLAIMAICGILVLTTLLALLRVAAHSDAQLELETQHEHQRENLRLPGADRESGALERVSSGRFARAPVAEPADRHLVR
jgi:hypothetical protein